MNSVLFKRGLSVNLDSIVPPLNSSSNILYLTTDTNRLYINKSEYQVKLLDDGTTEKVLDENGNPVQRAYITSLLAPNPEPLCIIANGEEKLYDGTQKHVLDLSAISGTAFEYGEILPNPDYLDEGSLFFQLIDTDTEWSISDIKLTGAITGSAIYDEATKKVSISTASNLAPLTIKVNGVSRGSYDGSENKIIDINLSSFVLRAGDTMSGPLKIAKTPEMKDGERVPTLTLSRTDEINYLELDCNKIQAKTGNGQSYDLYLNEKGGKVHIGIEDLGGENQFVYLVDGVLTDSTYSAGSDIKPIYMLNGKIKESVETVGRHNQFIFMQEGRLTASEATLGSNIKSIYIKNGEIQESTASIGTNVQPVYFNNGDITASTATVGNPINPIYMQNGVISSSTASVGLTNQPIFMVNGAITASTSTIGSSIKPIYMEDGLIKESSETVGSGKQLIYLEEGNIVASSENIGSSTQSIYMSNGELIPTTTSVGNNRQPIYMNNGVITPITASIGNNLQPIYMNNGLLMNSDANIGSEIRLIYMKEGTFTASSTSIGTSTKPVYLNNGNITVCSDTLDVNISGKAATAAMADKCKEAEFTQSATQAATALRLATPRNITVKGAVTGSAPFDGSSDIVIDLSAGDAASAGQIQVHDTNLDENYYITGVLGSGIQDVYRAYNTVGTQNTVGVYFNGVTGVLFGAAWNDYAEYRQTEDIIEAGRVIIENGDGTLSLSTERLQPGAEIVSDTFGFAIGETDKCKTPVAASGRVLAYPNEDRNSYKPGDAVCAGPNGTVSKMTRREIKKYPERIIGVVSEIPTYEVWGQNNVEVNNRIWIRIK